MYKLKVHTHTVCTNYDKYLVGANLLPPKHISYVYIYLCKYYILLIQKQS